MMARYNVKKVPETKPNDPGTWEEIEADERRVKRQGYDYLSRLCGQGFRVVQFEKIGD